jgi:hypothetical protein
VRGYGLRLIAVPFAVNLVASLLFMPLFSGLRNVRNTLHGTGMDTLSLACLPAPLPKLLPQNLQVGYIGESERGLRRSGVHDRHL